MDALARERADESSPFFIVAPDGLCYCLGQRLASPIKVCGELLFFGGPAMLRRLMVILTCVACISGMSVPANAAANDCDRACLKTALDQYLAAVTTHKPASAPLFAGFRQTENAVVVPLGSGVWKTVTALGKVQRRYLDAPTALTVDSDRRKGPLAKRHP